MIVPCAPTRPLFLALTLKLLGNLLHASYGYHRICYHKLKRRTTQVVRQAFRRLDELVDALPHPAAGNPDELVDDVNVAHSAPTPATSRLRTREAPQTDTEY